MTKQELLKTSSVEQLAEMVINLQSASEVKNDEIHKLKWKISSLEEENGRLQAKLDTYNNYLLPRATKEAKEMIGHNHFSGVRIVTWEQWNNRIEQESNGPDIRRYENTIDKPQSEVEKYRKAFEDAKKERDCQIAEYQKKIEELEKKSDFCFSEQPIKIADLMIHGWETSWDYKHLKISELRQIAEHLLVYCNHNEEVEE